MFIQFTEEARLIIINAKKEMQKLRHPYVGSEHLLLAILKSKNNVSKSLKKYGLDYKKFYDELVKTVGIGTKESPWFLYTPLIKRVMDNAVMDCKEQNELVKVEDLFIGLLEEGDGVAIRLLLSLEVDLDSLYEEFNNKLFKCKKKKLELDELGIDLTKEDFDPVIGRNQEIKRLLEILNRRTKNNPLLIGEAGVGKTAIVEELSRLIKNKEVPLNLRNKRIISLDMASLVSGTKYRGEFEERVKKILKEVEENDDIILFIDEIHTLVGAGGAEGAIDASNIFKPALARNKIRCIGATTISEYKTFIEKDKALSRRFQNVLIEAPNNNVVKEILIKLKPIYEEYHKVIIKDNLIDKIVELSNKYVFNRNQPDKAIDILDEACALASLRESKDIKEYTKLVKKLNDIIDRKNKFINNDKLDDAYLIKSKEFEIMNKINNLELKIHDCKNVVTINDIAEVITNKTKIPVYEIFDDKVDLKLFDSIVGQDKAVSEVSKIIKKTKLGFKDNRCYSFLFVGPTGVGKTELAKLFGKSLVNDNVIRLDMSEYSEAHSVSKIIGAPPGYVGYSDNKSVLEEIKNKPFSVLILDEIERAHPAVINLLFQILDNSKIKDSKGDIVNFNNITIVMTSNAGFENDTVGFNKHNDNLKDYFSLPFLNRIDNTIYFNRLTEENIIKIIKNKINKLIKKYESKIDILVNDNVILEILEKCNYYDFGARKIDKIIRDNIEDVVIDNIILNKKNIDINSLEIVVN